MRIRRVACLGGILAALGAWACAAEPVGQRPYEIEWAHRDQDDHPPLVDFEDLAGWTVACTDAQARFERTRQQQLWGKHVGTLVYRGLGSKPLVAVKPPRPIPIAAPFDCVNFWVYGNNWAWEPDRATPPVEIAVVLRGRSGQVVRVPMSRVHWKEWWVMHRKLTPDQAALVQGGAALEAIEVTGGRNTEDRTLHFDNLSVYAEALAPLTFEPRPLRNLTPLPGQATGTNTGPGRLPFPTREETILPDNLVKDFAVSVESTAQEHAFHYRGADGHLVYRYRPATGTLGDVTAEWEGHKPLQPMADGGVVLGRDPHSTRRAAEQGPPAAKLVRCRRDGDAVVANWQLADQGRSLELTYTLRLWQKSLVIDVVCPGGEVEDIRFGRAVGVEDPRLVTLPYLTGDHQRPAVVVSGPPQRPLFLMGLIDHCRSGASLLWAVNRIGDDGATYNGGSRYQPRTDGRRNDCFERLFLTISPRFEEVLPNVPNPKSPWMHVAGERLWIAHGASDRQRDYELWERVARYGMTKVVITDHETGWRDGGESFTLRTRAAPGRGGDESQAEYARKVRALGFRYGIYNNYTDFAPVNEHWNEDYVTRLSDGQWQPAWARCYNLKPSRAVELEARLAPIIQQKFHLDTAYCDVHTAVTPWAYCDRDARVPGAATFAATFFAYGEIMLHQKKTWDGPVYSEGNNHWFYCGLTDGNYGQDQAADLDENPWLVDFDLRKLHPLCCNFGMGNLGMFYGRKQGAGKTPEERDARLDRFLAATLAFGHTGFLVLDGGMPTAARSYFTLQQVHAAYAQATVAKIAYADQSGQCHETSAAVARGVHRRSQLRVEYSNGLALYVNGHPSDTWNVEGTSLPPNGWLVVDPRQNGLVAYSALRDGHRADYVDSPAYLYADGRGRLTQFPRLVSDGQVIAHKRPGGALDVIPVGACKTLGIRIGQDGQDAVARAVDEAGKELGPATTRWSRGYVFIIPVAKAFRYELTPRPAPQTTLSTPHATAVPGESIAIQDGRSGATLETIGVPKDAIPGTAFWHQSHGGWIHFLVVPMVDATLKVATADTLQLDLTANAELKEIQVEFLGESRRVDSLDRRRGVQLSYTFRREKGRVPLPLRLTAGQMNFQRSWTLHVEESVRPVAALPQQFQPRQCVRKNRERPLGDESGAQAHWCESACGGQPRRTLFMHPPYFHGTGYACAVFEPVELPAEPVAALRCSIGKADGSDPGDGIWFRVAVIEPGGKETVAAEKQWIQHGWAPWEVDLSRWAGRRVQIKLIADAGPADNSVGDWACWADLRLESQKPQLAATVQE